MNKKISLATIGLMTITAVLFSISAEAQISIKSVYIGSSKYKDLDGPNTIGTGDVKIIKASGQIPVSMRSDTVVLNADTIVRQKIWVIQAQGSYARFTYHDMVHYNFPSASLNGDVSIMHLRTLNKKWSLLIALGAGLYANPDHITTDQIMGGGALIFIRKMSSHLKLGGGISFDSKFGYPMVYPAIFVDWDLEGKYYVKINTTEFKAGVKVTDYLNVNAVLEFDGSLVLEKKTMFTHQYTTIGIMPELKISKLVTIPITFGLCAERLAYAHKRTVSDFFSYLGKENQPHFKPSPYISIAVKYGF